MNKKLLLAGCAGAVSLLLLIRSTTGFVPVPTSFSFALGLVSLLFYLCYVYGFAVLGEKYSVSALVYLSYAWIAAAALRVAYVYAFPTSAPAVIVDALFGFVIVGAVVIVGWTMINQRSRFGVLGAWYGIFAMLAGTGIPYALDPSAGTIVDGLCYALAIAIFFRAARQRS